MELTLHIAAGAAVGFAIGLTGVGGGSLMTPLLLLFGYPAPVAVGTDLLYAAITKSRWRTLTSPGRQCRLGYRPPACTGQHPHSASGAWRY